MPMVDNQTQATKSTTVVTSLRVAGVAILGVGAFYALASHSLHQALPFLAAWPRSLHVYLGGGGAVLGLVLILVAEKIDKIQRHGQKS